MAKDNEVSRAWILIWCMEDQVFYYKDIAMRIGEEIWMKANPLAGGSSCMEELTWIVGQGAAPPSLSSSGWVQMDSGRGDLLRDPRILIHSASHFQRRKLFSLSPPCLLPYES